MTLAPASKYSAVDYARFVYILYFVGFFFPITALGGLVLAYAKRDAADGVAGSHFEFQIRSFWIGLAALIIGGVLSLVLIGWLVIAGWTVWAVIRFVTGFVKLSDGLPVQDPEGLGFTA